MCSQISDSTKRKYTNPLNYVDSSSLPTNPDPFVLKFCGKYYCYSTDEFGVKVSVSNDLIDWHFLGFAMQEDGRKNYWAPGVDYWDGQFVMYYSSVPIDSQDPHDGFLRVATSKNPEGPFVLRKVLFDKFTIDAEIVANEEGERFLFYSANDITGTTADNTGTSILVDKLLKFDELEGNPQPVLVPTIEEEVFEENRFGDGRDWYTIEGASFTKHHGLTYLLYSANAYVRENYYIAYAVGKDHSEINQMNFEKYPNDFTYYPLMKKNESVEGTGHNSITLAPNNVDQWVVYHGRDSEEILDFEKEQRVMRMDPLFFFGEKLKINGPTHLEQNAPFLPTVQNYFNKNNETWKRYEENGIGFNLTTYKSPYYIYELDLSLENKNTGCRGGAVIGWLDELNYSLVLLDSGSNKVLIEQVVNGLSTIIQSYPVNSLKFYRVYHLKITRIFNHFEIIIDKQRIGKFSLDVAGECLGVCQKFSTIDFKYLAVTETVDLLGEEFRYFGNFFGTEEIASITNENQIVNYKKVPLCLNGEVRKGNRYKFDFGLPNSDSLFQIDFIDSDLKITYTKSKLIVTKDQEHLVEVSLDEGMTSAVYLDVFDDYMVLNHSAGHTILPILEDTNEISLNLVKAFLKGYQQTKIFS